LLQSNHSFILVSGSCFNHLRNVWIGAIEILLSRKVTQILVEELALIPPHLRVKCDIGNVCRCVDKEFNFTANYPKGHGDAFHDWMRRYHPGELMMPVIRTLGGDRQDSSFEGALPVYMGRKFFVQFLHEELCSSLKENILQTNMFIILRATEMIAQLRIASIIFIAVVVPMRWLAGKTHELGHRNWSERSMGRAVDLMYNAFVEVESDGELMLDEDFMMNIFSPLYAELPELKEYLTYYFEEKESNVIGSCSQVNRVLAIDLAKCEVFYPTRIENQQTNDLCVNLAREVATCLLLEVADPKKATSDYLSKCNGRFSWDKSSTEEKNSTIGMRATNDPSESQFATFTEALATGGRIGVDLASGIGQTRYNNDFGRQQDQYVTGRKSEARSVKSVGLFHELPTELQDSLVVTSKRNAPESRQKWNESLRMQRERRFEKKKAARDKKLEGEITQVIANSYLWQQFDSPRCCKSSKEAFHIFNELNSKSAKLQFVKEQILIRYLGLGWTKAYHPWSRNKHVFSPSELMEHFVKVVLPLENTELVPDAPPMNLPGLPSLPALGTVAHDVTALEEKNDNAGLQIRINAMVERERLEDNGFGDELMEMQEVLWPIDRLRAKDFAIDMLFEYEDEDGSTLVWCQGKVVDFIRESKDKHVIVKIEWSDTCVKDGDQRITKNHLKKTKWNPNVPIGGSWREDLYHKLMNKG
jgi:hypothetical protein